MCVFAACFTGCDETGHGTDAEVDTNRDSDSSVLQTHHDGGTHGEDGATLSMDGAVMGKVDGEVTVEDDAGVLPDATVPDATVQDCATNPHTHLEIINACTDADFLDKNPTLPLFLADGGLPDLL
jgi:hypothetical protein